MSTSRSPPIWMASEADRNGQRASIASRVCGQLPCSTVLYMASTPGGRGARSTALFCGTPRPREFLLTGLRQRTPLSSGRRLCATPRPHAAPCAGVWLHPLRVTFIVGTVARSRPPSMESNWREALRRTPSSERVTRQQFERWSRGARRPNVRVSLGAARSRTRDRAASTSRRCRFPSPDHGTLTCSPPSPPF